MTSGHPCMAYPQTPLQPIVRLRDEVRVTVFTTLECHLLYATVCVKYPCGSRSKLGRKEPARLACAAATLQVTVRRHRFFWRKLLVWSQVVYGVQVQYCILYDFRVLIFRQGCQQNASQNINNKNHHNATTTASIMTWKYLPLLNALLQILLTVGMGSIFGWAGVFEAQEFVPVTVRFVFYVALPCLVLNVLGIGMNFYSDNLLWLYIVAFLILRAIALVVIFIVVLIANWRAKERRYGLGHVAVAWLAVTWISTVIVGIPISTAVLGDPQKGRSYGLLAGISSFIFQLPLQLVFLECHTLDSDPRRNETPDGNELSVVQDVIDFEDEKWSQATNRADSEPEVKTSCISHSKTEQDAELERMEEDPNASKLTPQTETQETWWALTGGKYVNHRDVWLGILHRVVMNPVLWGIFWGFVLSLSTVGPKYLNPRKENQDFVEGLGWIFLILSWLGDTVSPLSLFTMGVWMYAQGIHRLLFAIPPPKLALYMLSKLVLIPLLMVGLAKMLSLQNEVGRAAVLIATLPISLASFSLGHQYRIGEAVLAANVAVGTLLMLPTVLVWNVVMDSLNLFPVT